MRKILSAVLLFSLAAALPVSAPAEKDRRHGGEPDFGIPLKGNSDEAAAAFANGTYNEELRAEDIRIFTSKGGMRLQPEVLAAAFHRAYSSMNPQEQAEFTKDHGQRIYMLIRSLGIAEEQGRITRETYDDLNGKILGMGFHTMDGRTPPAGFRAGDVQNRDGQNAVNAVVTATSRIYSRDASPSDKASAEEKLSKVTSDYKNTAWVQSAAADSYNKLGNYRMAEKTADAAIALDSNNPEAYKARALARASLEDRKGAIEDVKKAMAINPQDESAKLLSTLLESRKDTGSLKTVSSVDEMRRALGASDDGAEAVRGGGAQGRAAAGLAAEGEQAAPDFAKSKAYLKTALAKNRLGDYEEAARYATLAIEKDPANSEAYLERANAYNFLGRYDDAVRDATHVIEKEPANLQAFNMRAWALNRNGRSQDAASDATRAIDLNPNFADAWFNRALAYEKQGDYKRMLDDFKRAAALSGAYSGRYQDAVAQYGPRVPGYASLAPAAREAQAGAAPAAGSTPLRRFLTLLFFTLTGGALVAMGLIHILGGRAQAGEAGRITHPDVLSPSVFYEGVATGTYKIERKLGEGGMGVVYEATDQSLGRKVAIKKMNEEIKVNEREKQRFLDEARTVALLKHPGIVEIYTIFEEDSNIYLVFEHVDGVTLDHALDKEARLPFERARKIFSDAAGALAYAHSKNVVHRDLKLGNIMLSKDGEVKVMDFGLARRAMESMARSSSGEVVGSPAYMAPEQELGASSVESDIYSLGVCLYESLSGVLPFQGPDFHAQKTRLAYQKLSDMLPGLPKGVDEVVARCLAPEPENRFRSAEEFRRALDAAA
jgi:tetratricopeptide (TPR) repeat protein/tRNA A-37 threonylcarbamoyl transferase component Bud32